MNEITILDRLGAELSPTPDQEQRALARVRAELAAAAAAEPAAADPGIAPVTRLPVRRRRSARQLVAAAAAVALLGSGAVLAGTLRFGHDAPPASANAAAQVLARAADVTLRTSDPTVGANQYLKVTTKAHWLSMAVTGKGPAPAWLDEETLTTWIPGDAEREWVLQRSGRSPVKPLNAAGKTYLDGSKSPAPQPELLHAKNGGFYGEVRQPNWATPTPAWLAALPRDPAALYAVLREDAEGHGLSTNSEIFSLACDLLRTGMAPADLRAALFRVLADKVTGVTVGDAAANLDGKSGVGVGLVAEDGQRTELVFDKTTGQLIGEQGIILKAQDEVHLPAGTVTTSTSISTSVADTAP